MALTGFEVKKIQETLKKYDYNGFDTSFDFEAAADPPESYQCALRWEHPEWNKSLGNTIVTQYVRDEWWECLGGFPNLAAPGLLNQRDFRKFCYYARDFLLDDFPKNYLPHVYRDDPQDWEENKRRRKENRKRWKGTAMDKHLRELLGLSDSSSEDEDDQEENVQIESSSDDRKRPAVQKKPLIVAKKARTEGVTQEAQEQEPTLLSLDLPARARVADYLNPIEWWRLRKTCKETIHWPKPKAEIEYDFVFFSLNNGFDCVWHGVAHTLNDVRAAVLSLQHNTTQRFWQQGQLALSVELFKFNRKDPVVPLLRFEDAQYYCDPSPASVHEFGCRYFGVESVLSVVPFGGGTFELWAPDNDSEPNCDGGFGNYLQWCDGLEPRTRMDLEHIGIKKLGCTYCGKGYGACICDIQFGGREQGPDRTGPGGEEGTESIVYYSPRWFGDGKNRGLCHGATTGGEEQKNWIIFWETILLWDTY